MLVDKVINNNIISCLDPSGREIIMMGRGLGFHCKAGQAVRTELVEKTFHLETPQQTDRFKDLVRSLPPVYMDLCSRIIDYAATALNVPLRESVYLTLPDHVSFAVTRQKQGLSFHNGLEYEIRTFYPQEYAVGRYAVSLLREELGVALPEDEAASIALHLINAECDVSLQDSLRRTQTLHDILDFLSGHPQLQLQPGDPFYDEMAVLLKFLVQRSFSGEIPPEHDPQLVRQVRSCCSISYAIARQVLSRIESCCGQVLPDEEAAYLALHLRRVCRDDLHEPV